MCCPRQIVWLSNLAWPMFGWCSGRVSFHPYARRQFCTCWKTLAPTRQNFTSLLFRSCHCSEEGCTMVHVVPLAEGLPDQVNLTGPSSPLQLMLLLKSSSFENTQLTTSPTHPCCPLVPCLLLSHQEFHLSGSSSVQSAGKRVSAELRGYIKVCFIWCGVAQ